MEKKQNAKFWLLFSIVLIVLIFIQYYGTIRFHYHVPPGEDSLNHYNIAKWLENNGFFSSFFSGAYPPLYHYSILLISKVAKTDLMQTIVWTYPSLIIFASVSIFICANSLFGKWQGLIAMAIYGLTANSSITTQNDGMFPNLLASHILWPLLLAVLCYLLISKEITKKIVAIILLLIIFGLILTTHHFTTASVLMIFFVWLLVVIIFFYFKKEWSAKKSAFFLFGYLVLIALFLFIFLQTDTFASAKALANNFTGIKFLSYPPYISLQRNIIDTPWSLRVYPLELGFLAIIFGFLGVVANPIAGYIKGSRKVPVMFMISIMIVTYFIVSRTSFVSYPYRLVRDLIVPLSISAGGTIVYMIDYIKKHHKKMLPPFILLILIIFSLSFRDRLLIALNYNTKIRMTDADMKAVQFLSGQRANRILVFGLNTYLPIFYTNGTFVSYDSSYSGTYIINNFDYFYVVDKQKGWLPSTVPVGIPKELEGQIEKDISLEYTYTSPINEVKIYRVKRK